MIVAVWGGQEGKDLRKWSNGEQKIFPEKWIVENSFFLAMQQPATKGHFCFFTNKIKKYTIYIFYLQYR